jgi:RNA polymerase sigma factor (sigma-70 family)
VTAPDVRSRLAAEVPGLLRYARTITADAQLAEDLVQETMLRALQRADSFRADASLATWLHRILHNLAVDRFRADQRNQTRSARPDDRGDRCSHQAHCPDHGPQRELP